MYICIYGITISTNYVYIVAYVCICGKIQELATLTGIITYMYAGV